MREKDTNKKNSIFEATLELINTQGLANLSMAKIAKLANVSPATIYIYFENKDALINQLYLKTKQEMSAAVFAQVDASQDLKQQYCQILRNFIVFIMESKKEFLFLEQLQNVPVIAEKTQEETDELFSALVELYALGIEQGRLKDVDLRILATATSSIAMEYVKSVHKGLFTGSEQEITQIIAICWDAVAK